MKSTLRILIPTVLTVVSVLITAPSPGIAQEVRASEEQQLLGMLNQARAGEGLPPLEANDALRGIARRQAQVMVSAGQISHTQDLHQQVNATGLPWSSLGENVGSGPTTESVHEALMASPPHRANILNPQFRLIGIGAASDASGMLYFSQDFVALRSSPAPTAPTTVSAPARPARVRRVRPAAVKAQAAPVSVAAAGKAAPPAIDYSASLDRYPLMAAPQPTNGAAKAAAVREPRSRREPSVVRAVGGMFGRVLSVVAFWR